MIKIIGFVLLAIIPAYSFACKDALYRDKYPITNFSGYSDVIVAKVIQSRQDNTKRYNPLISFDAVVSEKLKGELKANEVIHVSAKIEEPHAVCPVQLKANSMYLLLLERDDGQLQISRFSFPIENTSEYFSSYLSQVKSIINGP